MLKENLEGGILENNQEDLENIKKELFILIKSCDNSSEFLDYARKKIDLITDPNILSEIKLSLEKINAGVMVLSNSDFSEKNNVEEISEKTKATELIIRGWFSIKEILAINMPTRIEKMITLINQKHAN